MTPAREKLKAVVAKAATLENQKSKLEIALQTAEDELQAAIGELQRFSDLDTAIKRFRVDAVKSGGNSRELPQVLKDRLVARRSAEEEIEQATGTRDAIAEELEDVRNRLLPIDEPKTICALDVLREMADEVAGELIAINERRRDLRQILESLASISVVENNLRKFAGYTSAVSRAMDSHGSEFYPNQDPIGDMSKRWQARLDLLKVNPDAKVTVPSAIAPSDYVRNGVPTPSLVRSEQSIVATTI